MKCPAQLQLTLGLMMTKIRLHKAQSLISDLQCSLYRYSEDLYHETLR